MNNELKADFFYKLNNYISEKHGKSLSEFYNTYNQCQSTINFAHLSKWSLKIFPSLIKGYFVNLELDSNDRVIFADNFIMLVEDFLNKFTTKFENVSMRIK